MLISILVYLYNCSIFENKQTNKKQASLVITPMDNFILLITNVGDRGMNASADYESRKQVLLLIKLKLFNQRETLLQHHLKH